ncbi:MAG: hypothetical protein AAGA27_01510 [Pseudomonadota bacterium]
MKNLTVLTTTFLLTVAVSIQISATPSNYLPKRCPEPSTFGDKINMYRAGSKGTHSGYYFTSTVNGIDFASPAYEYESGYAKKPSRLIAVHSEPNPKGRPSENITCFYENGVAMSNDGDEWGMIKWRNAQHKFFCLKTAGSDDCQFWFVRN